MMDEYFLFSDTRVIRNYIYDFHLVYNGYNLSVNGSLAQIKICYQRLLEGYHCSVEDKNKQLSE